MGVFGVDLEASFTENIAELNDTMIFRTFAAGGFLVKIQLTAPLLLNAIMVSVSAPSFQEPEWPARRVLALAALSIFTGLTAAAFADEVAAVASLTGSLFTMTTSVLFPAVVHLRLMHLYGPKGDRSSRLNHYFVLTFGIVMA